MRQRFRSNNKAHFKQSIETNDIANKLVHQSPPQAHSPDGQTSVISENTEDPRYGVLGAATPFPKKEKKIPGNSLARPSICLAGIRSMLMSKMGSCRV